MMGGLEMLFLAERSKGEALSDEDVVERVRAGETALFEILMRRYNQRLYRVARAILRSDAEAEDVMQEAYVRAFTHLDQFANRAKFSTWLARIAVNEALARARRSSRFEAIEPAMESEADPKIGFVSSSRDPERQMFDREMKALLESAIDALPPEYRSVFVLREIEEMSTAEAAEALAISEEAVKTRLHRARARLRGELYDRVGSSKVTAFEFHLSRCDRVVTAVLERIMKQGRIGQRKVSRGGIEPPTC